MRATAIPAAPNRSGAAAKSPAPNRSDYSGDADDCRGPWYGGGVPSGDDDLLRWNLHW